MKTSVYHIQIFPEYTKGYYAVFFEDPDRIKLELDYNHSKK